jgi:hypothetical protein
MRTHTPIWPTVQARTPLHRRTRAMTKHKPFRRLIIALLSGAMAAVGALAATAAPASAAPTGSSIVSVAQRELNDSSRNYEAGNNCSYYGGEMFNWPACGGKAGWGGGSDSYSWCAAFSKYVWREGGVTSYLSEIDGFAQSFKEYGQNHATYRANGAYTPKPGDAVVFDWDHNPNDAHQMDHVGIVTSVSGSTLYTIEGNTSDATRARSYPNYADNADIEGFTTAVGVSSGAISGTASVYGVLADGRLTYSTIDAATGNRTKTVVSTTSIGFTPKAMATLNFNTILITDTASNLYRIDVITNNTTLVYNAPVVLGTGWSHELLTYDGNSHLFGIRNGDLRRYTVSANKPTAANISPGQLIGGGFALNTLSATASNWLIGTTPAGALLSYKMDSAGNWKGNSLATDHWYFDEFLSPGNGVYYGRTSGGGLYRYLDANPFDSTGSDIQSFASDPVDTTGWTQTLLSTQPNTITKS